jgi:hypothetical protein
VVIVDWLDHYPLTYVTALSREWSDHTPMLIDTGIGCVKLFHFKLELCWLTREDVMDVVRPVWEVDAGNRTPIEEWVWRLDETRKKLRGDCLFVGKPQEKVLMNIAASFPSIKKPRYVDQEKSTQYD